MLKAAITAGSPRSIGLADWVVAVVAVDSCFTRSSSSFIFAAFFSLSFVIAETAEFISLLWAIFLISASFSLSIAESTACAYVASGSTRFHTNVAISLRKPCNKTPFFVSSLTNITFASLLVAGPTPYANRYMSSIRF